MWSDGMRQYIAIDLKSFYASVECVERGLNPLTTNLVVADESRTEKTICLAVSPSLKSYGISGRARLFEVVQRVKEINRQRLAFAPGREFNGSSYEGESGSKAGAGLYCGEAADGTLHGIQYAHLRYLPEICRAGGYACLFGG